MNLSNWKVTLEMPDLSTLSIGAPVTLPPALRGHLDEFLAARRDDSLAIDQDTQDWDVLTRDMVLLTSLGASPRALCISDSDDPDEPARQRRHLIPRQG